MGKTGMPNTDQTHKGSSLKRRFDTAMRLTAQEQRARKNQVRDISDAPSSTRSERASRSRQSRSETREGARDGSRSHGSGTGSRAKDRASSKSRSTRNSSRNDSDSARDRSKSRSSRGESRKDTAGVGSGRSSDRSSRRRDHDAQTKEKRSFQVPGFVEKLVPKTLKTRIIAGVIAFFVIAFVLLYPVGQTYYQSMRELQLNEARVAAEERYNEAVSKKNEELKTDEGIEAEAREQLGLVKEGEQAAIVTNKDGSSIEGAGTVGSRLPEQVDMDAIEPPHTWYYDILDTIFFVKLD